MLPREDLLKGVENRESIARVIDLADQAIKTWEVVCTDFLSPPELVEIQQQFKRLTEVQLVAWGGYPQAERQRIAIARSELPLEPSQVEVAAIDIAGNFLFDPATHRDFLGSMLGCGVVREKTGDVIVLGERGAQAVVVPELLEYMETHLTQVRSVPVRVQRIEFSELISRTEEKTNDNRRSINAFRCDRFCRFWCLSQQNDRLYQCRRCASQLERHQPSQLPG